MRGQFDRSRLHGPTLTTSEGPLDRGYCRKLGYVLSTPFFLTTKTGSRVSVNVAEAVMLVRGQLVGTVCQSRQLL